MAQKTETIFAVWCGLLLGVALGTVGTLMGWHQGTLPVWTDPFYSGWAQTIGSLLAVYAAIRIGRNQVNADRILRAEERRAEEILALQLAREAVNRAWAVTRSLSAPSDMDSRHDLRASALAQLEQAVDELGEPRRMKIHPALRHGIQQSLQLIRTFLELQRLYERPLTQHEFGTLRAIHKMIDAEKLSFEELAEEFDGLDREEGSAQPAVTLAEMVLAARNAER